MVTIVRGSNDRILAPPFYSYFMARKDGDEILTIPTPVRQRQKYSVLMDNQRLMAPESSALLEI